MKEVYLTLFGAFLGFLGAVIGGYISENRSRKKEIKELYSWINSLMYRLFEMDEIHKVKDSLTAQTLHYSFNRLWAYIPRKKGNLEVRQLTFKFLKGGSEIEKFKKDENMYQLYQWLEKNMK